MLHRIKSRITALIDSACIILKSSKYLFSKYKLPPGGPTHLYVEEMRNQKLILELSAKYGPIFRGRLHRKIMVCIIGLPLCQQFNRECKNQIKVATVDLTSLFPQGFLRGMEGEAHKKYRNSLVRGISPDIMEKNAKLHENIVHKALLRYAHTFREQAGSPDDFKLTLHEITSSLLIQAFFGIHPESPEYDWLFAKYKLLGEIEFSWAIENQQQQTYQEIRVYFLKLLKEGCLTENSSILGNMHREGIVDESSLGNLIYMVEMGRHDLSGLFRWLSKYACEQPEHLDRIAKERIETPEDGQKLCLAFVQETLRLNQIERLTRSVISDIHFQGYFIPKGSVARMCLWESHKDPDNFPEPFEFKPERFFDETFSLDEYAPFGLGHHRCPIGQMSLQMSCIFMESLAANYSLEAIGNGPPYRADHHWEPAREFSVLLHPK